MSLAGDSGNCMTVVDQVSWRQSMQPFVYCHGELVLNPLATLLAANEGRGAPERVGSPHVSDKLSLL